MSVVKEALSQLDQRGLRKLLKHMEAGKPLLLNGDIVDQDGTC